MKKSFFLRISGLVALCVAVLAAPLSCLAGTAEIGFGGNAYVTRGNDGRDVGITAEGIVHWANPDAVVSVFFSVAEPQRDVQLSLRGLGRGNFEIEIPATPTQPRQVFTVSLSGGNVWETVPVGKVSFDKAGYQRADIRRIAGRRRAEFVRLKALVLDGVKGEVTHSRDFNALFARRGPSVHLTYPLPRGRNFEYFYNEISVPRDADRLGAYFMACGFGEGYFGIQVNSERERRVLFSVWSPYNAQNPRDVPADFRVRPVRSGAGVHVGEFGSEGTGGQSFLRYPWVAGTTYKFLVRVHPSDDGSTRYAAFFYAPEEGKWRLIAEFARPKTSVWLNFAHSFLENFYPQFGWRERSVEVGNTWARDTDGNWTEITNAKFSCDSTGRAGARRDFAGGLTRDGKSFCLRQCGFFSETTEPDVFFERQGGSTPPEIDFDALDSLGEKRA